MLCENCNKNVATVHLIEIVNQEKKEINLCENCAQETGLPFSKPDLSVTGLFGMVGTGTSQGAKPKDSNVHCPQCGMTLREFRSKGRFGCSHDYEVFKNHLDGLLEKIHGATRHIGKMPQAPSPQNTERRAKTSALENLRKRLNFAVEQEEYEEAAKLRDQINEIEKEIKAGSENPS